MTQPANTLLILGASGDLSSRLLMPALGQLLTSQPDRRLNLVGSGVEDWDEDRWRDTVSTSFKASDSSGDAVDAILKGTKYIPADVTKSEDLKKLLDACDGVPAIYFALPPAITARACEALEDLQLPAGTILALEKPFGTDRDSAVSLNRQILRLVPEDQIHRVDHFLGNSTVLNMLGLRFANRIFEPLWSSDHIESVDIVYDESLALEGRARYYDKAGALVDMLQSHLLQVMSVFAMEPPATLDARDIRDAKGAVLRATRVWNDDPKNSSHRGRYEAGEIDGRKLPSYVDEKGVDPSRNTETLAQVAFGIENWRWSGVPFTLRSGKALGERRHEVCVTFRKAQHVPNGLKGVEQPTKLRLRLGPDSMALELNVSGPGDPYTIDSSTLEADFGAGSLRAYGEVLEGIFDGDPTLSVRGDAAEDCWRILTPVIEAWKKGEVPLDGYKAGSAGPSTWPSLG
ncbi:glucose-6-phosphate dehydrogenase [Microbacterium sp. STN6]|uniref:glucose-6-phosphate dehydrogenase n=1 Tax=Microbacterium sp. STN6 TaxID=2995588 RepID=UPI002260F88E|nr:glucose-6-phosphate dehydrogenase [Microbacterium sp. STN6]MCX7522032.1 glucose-6-phosphate dehydrogenase [Microbacterium sp. STN6]